MCQAAGIKFIGPTARSIKLMGDKIKARETMIKAGVPVLPGSKNEIGSDDEARKIAEEIGYPVIIKAAAGGGGKRDEDRPYACQPDKLSDDGKVRGPGVIWKFICLYREVL